MVNEPSLKLPLSIIGSADLQRLLREAEKLNDQVKGAQPPTLSHAMQEYLAFGGIDLAQAGAVDKLIESLKNLSEKAPSVHISLSADPSPESLRPLVEWLRQNISPLLLVRIGLKPNLGAGCIFRTPNKRFDMSLRHYLASKQDVLVKELIAIEGQA